MIAKGKTLAVISVVFALTGCGMTKTVDTTSAPSTVSSNKKSLNFIPGEWTISKVDGKTVTGDDRPYITFEPTTNKFYGNNGCNTLNGDYSLSNGNIGFRNVIATMRACPDAPFEYMINVALDKARHYSISNHGNEHYMTLTSEKGNEVMVLRRHNMEFLNGGWDITEVNGEPTDSADGMQLMIDIAELKVHGNTGCNILNGELLIDPDKPNAIQFNNMATTHRACHNMDKETALLLALEDVEQATKAGNNQVNLLNREGQKLVVLTKQQH